MSQHFASLSPIDAQPVWRGSATEPAEIQAVMGRAAEAAHGWRNVPRERRIEIARAYASYLQQQRAEIESLLTREIGKLPWDAAAEVNAAIAKIDLSVTALDRRRAAVAEGPPPGTSAPPAAIHRHVHYRPLGVTLVLGPFNFPLHLPGGQIIPALLAGNTVVFKPSEQATAVGLWMVDAWHRCGLPKDVLQPILGGAPVAAAAIESPHLNGVFLTGSRAAGRAVHGQLAGRPHVLLALEMGGNNPIVVTESAAADRVAAVASFSAFVSAGQRCTCARRVIVVESEASEDQIVSLAGHTERLRVGLPGESPTPQVGPLISPAAVDQLQDTYQRLLRLGCHPMVPWAHGNTSCLVRPMLLDASGCDARQIQELGDMEWFGPLLVVQRVPDFQTALESAANTPYGLAAALLGGTRDMFESFLDRVPAGVVNWNGPTTGAAGGLPFGGLGDSGNHRPAGYFAIDFCHDPIASLRRDSLPADDPWGVVS